MFEIILSSPYPTPFVNRKVHTGHQDTGNSGAPVLTWTKASRRTLNSSL